MATTVIKIAENATKNLPSSYARPLHLSPEVATILSISGANNDRVYGQTPSGAIAIEKSNVRAVKLASRKQDSTSSNAPRKESFETDVTFVETSVAQQPSNASTSSSTNQQRGKYAKPLVVSDDVTAILQGRMRGGGLSLGGEPMRATAKGPTKPTPSNAGRSASSTSKTGGLARLFGDKKAG